ncbi:Transient receptor potential cation channel subfamily A member 1, partial [Acipenser ruthenus]
GHIAELQPLIKMKPDCLRGVDSSNSSPLHYAAGGGCIQLIQAIINTTGSEGLNVTDNKRNTPLHLAVKNKQSESCRTLLELGADPNILNANLMSPLHMAINLRHNEIVEVLLSHSSVDMNLEGDLGNTPVMLACSIDNHEALNLLAREEMGYQIERHINCVDKSGSSPLHLAVHGGNIEVIQLCIANGAKIDLQQSDKSTALHFACTQGAIEAVKLMLSTYNGGQDVVNIIDGAHQTLLHKVSTVRSEQHTLDYLSQDMFCKQGAQGLSVCLLKDVKELLNDEDNEGCIPLHYACRLGIQESVTNMLGLKLLETIRDSRLLNEGDENGMTPLHLASQNGHIKVVELLLRKGALFLWCHEAITTFKYGSTKRDPKLEMIEFMPKSFKLLLDRSMKESEDDVSSQDYCIEYNFQYLQCPMKNKKLSYEDKDVKCQPLVSLNTMVQFNRVELLTHPVSKKYLEMKWLAYGLKAHVLNLAIYSLGLVPLTILIVNLRPEISVNRTAENGTEVREVTMSTQALDKHNSFYTVCMILVLVMTLYAVGKEMVQIYRQCWRYFLDYSNYFDWCVAVESLLFVIPLLYNSQEHWPWQCGAIAVFHSWINFLLYMQRFERFGIYVVMFGEILRTLFCIILLFFFLNLAFALAFYALMLEQIGLAVGDIAEVQRNACLKRIAMQIDLHTNLEEKLPYWFMKRVDQVKVTVFPNRAGGLKFPAFWNWNGKPESRTRLNTGHCQSTPLEFEVQTQKYRLKDISKVLEKQHSLLKRVVQKMEIVSEADEQDDTELFQYGNAKRQQLLHNKSKWNSLVKAVHDKKHIIT